MRGALAGLLVQRACGMSLRPSRAARDVTLGADRLSALWAWLSSWIARDGGVNGPVVHRGDLKRMTAIHDTAWTQHAVVEGLLQLYRRSGNGYWLDRALALADAQCARQQEDGRFRWAGHEDDRFSSLVHNALADCALLDLADTVREEGDRTRGETYTAVAERNLERYVLRTLYRPVLRGFAMNAPDYYAGRDRFVVNMNSIAIEALVKLEGQRRSDRHAELVRSIGEEILSSQSRDGLGEGGLAYSNLEPHSYIALYTALTLRGLPALAGVTGDGRCAEVAKRALRFLDRVQDPETGLWFHKVEGERLVRFPIFVAGAGMICNGILAAAELAGMGVDADELGRRLLRFQHCNGAIRNFVGYDHPDNGRRRGSGGECWEDVYPTPNWNAQAFSFLARVVPPPDPPAQATSKTTCMATRRYVYVETPALSGVAGLSSSGHGIAALFVKRWRYGIVVPGPRAVLRAVAQRLSSTSRRRVPPASR
jgi:hypothetical protein